MHKHPVMSSQPLYPTKQHLSKIRVPQEPAGALPNSNELTDILIIVVRYFGGIKLGTSGLIVAYKAAAAEAIAAADIVERTVDEEITVSFEYPFMNDIMRIVKEDEPAILEQSYDMDCLMRLRIRKSMMGKLRARLEKVETARIIE